MGREKHGGDPDGYRHVVSKVLVTGGVGGVAYLLTNLANQPQIWVLTVSVFIGGVALVVQFLADFEARLVKIARKLTRDSRHLHDGVRADIATISEATALFSQVGAGKVRNDLVMNLVRYAVRLDLSSSALIVRVAGTEFARLTEFLKQIADSQEANYPGQEQDWLYALVDNSTSSICATSTFGEFGKGFVDDNFWRSQEADTYLKKQRDAVRRGVEVQRIFIVEANVRKGDGPRPAGGDSPVLSTDEISTLPGLSDIVRRNQSHGVKTMALLMSAIPHREIGDFIVFDNQVSYEFFSGPSIIPDGPSTVLRTRLDIRADGVASRRQRFEELWRLGSSPTEPADSKAGNGPDRSAKGR